MAYRSYDCATDGSTCGWQDDQIGNNCLADVEEAAAPVEETPVDPCGGETFEGRCDGDTLIWCQDAAVYEADCSADGLTCGWESDQIGNNCL